MKRFIHRSHREARLFGVDSDSRGGVDRGPAHPWRASVHLRAGGRTPGSAGLVGHVTLFYMALILCISALLRATTGREARRVVPAVAAGLVLGILPPIIDVLVYGAGQFNYTYRLDFFRTFPLLLYDPPSHTPKAKG